MFKEVFLDLYNRSFILVIGGDTPTINRYLSEKLEVPIELEFTGVLGQVERLHGKHISAILVYIRDATKDNFNLGTISHEGVHAASELFKFCGIKHDDLDNEEHYAYLVDWVVRQILGAVDEYNAE